MKRLILIVCFLVSMLSVVRADFVRIYQNTGSSNSSDYRKASIWVRAKNYPSTFLDKRPVEINKINVTESLVKVVLGAVMMVSFMHNPNSGDYTSMVIIR